MQPNFHAAYLPLARSADSTFELLIQGTSQAASLAELVIQGPDPKARGSNKQQLAALNRERVLENDDGLLSQLVDQTEPQHMPGNDCRG